MRQLIVQVPSGRGLEAMKVAREYDGVNLACLNAVGDDGPLDLVLIHTPNHRVGELLDALEKLPDLHITFAPQGVFTLEPPADQVPQQVKNVTERSPIEIFLAGLQSVGSWKGFLGYAAAAGAVVWIGLFTNTTYLLTAAMLIAPFAGPAMTAAIATARGDTHLLGRSLLRYFSGLGVTIVMCAGLSLALRQQVATAQMVDVSDLSSTAVLLPLVAGAAGALNLVQSERNSLVSGAATGLLIAASLAPPAGLIGMGAVIGKWGMVQSAIFVLLLQIVGINLSGALIFRAFGLKTEGPRFARGKKGVFPAALGLTVLLLGGLLTWQFWDTPAFQRSTREQRAAGVVQSAVEESGLAHLVETTVRFTRANIPGQNSLLIEVYVQPAGDRGGTAETGAQAASLKTQLSERIKERLRSAGFHVTPLIDLTILDPGS